MIRGSCPNPRSTLLTKMRAQAGFHANDARRQLLERVFETQAPDLPAEGDLPIDRQSYDVKNLLADVDTDDRLCGRVGLLPRLHSCHLRGAENWPTRVSSGLPFRIQPERRQPALGYQPVILGCALFDQKG